MNPYQKRKAKAIAALLVIAAAQSDNTPMTQLADLVSRFTEEQWRTVAFQAKQAVPDTAARVLVVAMLLGLQ